MPLLAGFTVSAVAVFALTSAAGALARTAISIPTEPIVVVALTLCATTDLAFPRIRRSLLTRQAPRSLSGRFSLPITGALWGLDTGTVVSTFRVSAASWSALILTFAGWGPWWTGLSYAAAFCVPLGLLIATYPVDGAIDERRRWRTRSTESLVGELGRAVKYVRYAAAAPAVVGITLVVQGAL